MRFKKLDTIIYKIYTSHEPVELADKIKNVSPDYQVSSASSESSDKLNIKFQMVKMGTFWYQTFN